MDEKDHNPVEHTASRRTFLRRVALATATPLLASACVREPERTGDQVVTDDDGAVAAHEHRRRPPLPEAEPVIRVRVHRVRDERALVIDAPAEWIELTVPDADVDDEAAWPAMLKAPVTVTARRGGWSVRDAHRFRPPLEAGWSLSLRAVDRAGEGGPSAGLLAMNDRSYPGVLRLVPREEAGFDVVNDVAAETYLPGVLTGELYAHWEPATFEAQAIAARSYACSEHVHFTGRRHYDVTSTASSQVYGGADSNARARDAVAATRGRVLAWSGALVPGYYSACCGGRAANATDVIGAHPFNDVAPLRGRSGPDGCSGAPLHTWTMERPLRAVVESVRAYGRARRFGALRDLRSIRSIDVVEVNPHGRPRRYLVTPNAGDAISLSAVRLRDAVDRQANRRLWSSDVRVMINRGIVRFDGRGHGHGAGLCQHGAQVLALEGKSADEIAGWYYPGAEIVTAYG